MHRGYIKLWRKTLDNPHMTDPDFLAVWVWMLFEAKYQSKDVIFNGKRVTLRPGQFTAGRKQIAVATGVSESKVFRVINVLKSEQQIEQLASAKCSMFSILNWDKYQNSEQQIEQQVNSYRTASEQLVNTTKEGKNDKKEKNIRERVFTPPSVDEVQAYCQERGNTINAEAFVAFYASKGWVVGRSPMKDWRRAVITWEIKRKEEAGHGNGDTYTDERRRQLEALG